MKYRYLENEEFFLNNAKEIFARHFPFDQGKITDFNNFYSKLSDENKEKLLKISFFYYFRGWKSMQKENWYEEVTEDNIFIVLISIAETILSEHEYETFISWIKKNHSNTREIKDEINLYLKDYGLINKFIKFFDSFLIEKDRESFIAKIKVFSKKDKKHINLSIKEIATLLYSLRSNFVHNSGYIPLSAGADVSAFTHKGESYYFAKKFPDIVSIFERGFLNYFLLTIKK